MKSKYINLSLKIFVKFVRTFSYKLFRRKIFRTHFFVLLITTRLSELARHCCVNGIVYCILESHLKAVPFLLECLERMLINSYSGYNKIGKKLDHGKLTDFC